MKAKTFFLLWSVIILTLPISSCTKESQEDPRFSCKINGELWNPKDGAYSFGLSANYDYQPDINRDVFDILAAKHDHPKFLEIELLINMPQSGIYIKRDPKLLSLLTSDLRLYFLDTTMAYHLNIERFNTNTRDLKGMFDGFLYDIHDSSTNRIHITEGKFNVKF